MDHSRLATRSDELRATRTPFVHARVVLVQRPASATPGDEALVLPDGTIEGFVGGTCAESTVREQSLQAMASGQPRIVRITPTPQPDEHAGKVVVHNTCLSGGILEVFLEPHLPPPLLVVVGDSPIAAAVMAVGEAVGWQVRRWVGIIPEDADALVVATHGRDEHEALAGALAAGVAYVGLVASPTRGDEVVATLDVDDRARHRIDTPAGLDIRAHTAKEVAVSILAGIIAARDPSGAGHAHEPAARDAGDDGQPGSDRPDTQSAGGAGRPPDQAEGHRAARSPVAPGSARDPVCGMAVAMIDASLHVEHDDDLVWFCGSGCMQAFLSEPANFIS